MPVSTTSRLPMAVDEITANWVTEALQARYPGVEVIGIDYGETLGGTASKVLLNLEYNAAGIAAGLPPSLYAKGGFHWHKVSFANSFRAEGHFYRDWAPLIEANIPKGYYGGWNEEQGIALIENLNLRGGVTYGVGDPQPLSVDGVIGVLKLLAQIHAAFWRKPEVMALRTLGERIGTNFIDYMLVPSYWAQCCSEPRGSTVPAAFHDTNRVFAGLKAMWAMVEKGPQTFCHGDPHQGNLFYEADGTPGYLDFQAYIHGSSLHDVNYLIVGALSVEDRQKQDRELLKFYLSQLRQLGIDDAWPFDEAWERFRRHTMHGLLWFTTPPEMQPVSVVTAHGIRFGAAAQDYRTAEALGV
jgi:hypothetical protein